jgi:hypothetical protein
MNVRRVVAALAIFAIVATGLGVSIAMIMAPDPPPQPPPSTLAAPTPKMPTPAEFQIGVVVTEQNCDGPNGCVYRYRVEPKYLGLHPLPDSDFTVSYRVTGGHQPQDGDFTVAGGQAQVLQNVPLEGPPGAHLAAAVTKIVG